MRPRSIMIAFALAAAATTMSTSQPVIAANAQDCGASSSDAVNTLPVPLNRWAQIVCTPYGEVMTGHEGWVWVEPVKRALVVIPSASLDLKEAPPDNVKAYFTKIEIIKIIGEEFDKAYSLFHVGFDSQEGKPVGYRLELGTASGDGLQLYILDYFTYGVGISCPSGNCDRSSRFVMVNVHHEPKPLPPPI